MSKVYGVAVPSVHLRRSAFDMSYRKLFTAQFGKLIPVYLQDCVPGDYAKIGNQIVVRTQPLAAPLMSNINVYVHYFFVPYRILGSIVGASNPFVASITGYKNGVGYTTAKETEEYSLPRVSFGSSSITLTNGEYTNDEGKTCGFIDTFTSDGSTYCDDDNDKAYYASSGTVPYNETFTDCLRMTMDNDRGPDLYNNTALRCTAKNTLWDFFGFPVMAGTVAFNATNMAKYSPLMLPWYAYNMIYNEYYRDENLQQPVLRNNNAVLNRCVGKDYFTSALPFQQKGTAPQISINDGIVQLSEDYVGQQIPLDTHDYPLVDAQGTLSTSSSLYAAASTDINELTSEDDEWFYKTMLVNGSISINDIRLANSIQLWQETNARCGNRWDEYLRAHYQTSAGDDRINRPVYIGGTKQHIVTSEVLNQSGSGTLGDMAGHGISGASQFVGKYHVREHGVIMGIMSIMPENVYSTQGIAEEWVKNTRYDWYSPEFADLGEQPIPNGAIYYDCSTGTNTSTFGFQGAWDYMRSRRSEVCSNMRDTFDYWHTARKFSSMPSLNGEFLACQNSNYNRVFMVQDEDGFIVDCYNKADFIRPLPALSIPRSL